MRTIVALGLTSVLVATTCAQVVLGNGNGGIRAVNALAGAGQPEQPLQWSRRDFTDNTNSEIFGFFPAYTIRSDDVLFDFFGNNMGFGGATTPVTITTVDSLRSAPYNWPASFTVPQYLFRQGGAYTNRSNNGDHGVEGTVWIKYELDDSNPNGWNVAKVQVFAWDVRDIVHKASANKTRSFSDTAAPYQIDIYVAQNDPNPDSAPQSDPNNWTFVGTLSKANGTLPNVCEWDPNTGNTFGECPRAMLDYLNGDNPAGVRFCDDPTNAVWYSTLNVSGQSGVRYVALVIPQGNQYGQDPTLNASSRTTSSLRYTNITDVRVIAGIPGDVNGDGCVDDADLLIVLFNFGNAGGQGDVNNDNIVDDADLLIVLFNFGAGC